jgi:anaerobic selenocysteine-containing dehydrogenase
MVTGTETRISSHYHQVKAGGDIGAIMGVCKALIVADDEATATGAPHLLDTAFIAEHTHGFDRFADVARSYSWSDLEKYSGLSKEAMESAARILGSADAGTTRSVPRCQAPRGAYQGASLQVDSDPHQQDVFILQSRELLVRAHACLTARPR